MLCWFDCSQTQDNVSFSGKHRVYESSDAIFSSNYMKLYTPLSGLKIGDLILQFGSILKRNLSYYLPAYHLSCIATHSQPNVMKCHALMLNDETLNNYSCILLNQLPSHEFVGWLTLQTSATASWISIRSILPPSPSQKWGTRTKSYGCCFSQRKSSHKGPHNLLRNFA